MSKRIDVDVAETILRGDDTHPDILQSLGLEIIAELKKRYEEIDNLHKTLGNWGLTLCPRSNEWFEWDYGCQSPECASHGDDCRELIEASQ